MTQAEEAQLLRDVAFLKSTVEDIDTALRGTRDDKRIGVLHRVSQHHDDLNDAEFGLKKRVRAVEQWRAWVIGWAVGAGAIAGAAVKWFFK